MSGFIGGWLTCKEIQVGMAVSAGTVTRKMKGYPYEPIGSTKYFLLAHIVEAFTPKVARDAKRGTL